MCKQFWLESLKLGTDGGQLQQKNKELTLEQQNVFFLVGDFEENFSSKDIL